MHLALSARQSQSSLAGRPRRGRRLALGAGAACIATMALAAPSSAHAASPVGACPGPFQLQAISQFSPGTQAFLVASIDRNGDGQVCTKPLPEAIPFLNISFIDNLSQS